MRVLLVFFIFLKVNCLAYFTDIKQIRAPAIIFDGSIGGLGNQLFRYACAYGIAKKHHLNLYTAIKVKKNRSFKNTAREYALDFFEVPQVSMLKKKHIDTLKYHAIYDADILQNNISQGKVLYLNDYCESEVFFEDNKDEIKKLFQFKEDKIQEIVSALPNPQVYQNVHKNIQNTQSVCVHVRRGDFTQINDYWALPISYQVKAMKFTSTLIQQPSFYIFSDDINYAKQHLQQFNPIYISEHGFPSIIDFYLMTQCKHNIVANSTFSWWAAYLNNNHGYVIGPLPRYQKQWYKEIYADSDVRKLKEHLYQDFAYPKEWLTVNPFDS